MAKIRLDGVDYDAPEQLAQAIAASQQKQAQEVEALRSEVKTRTDAVEAKDKEIEAKTKELEQEKARADAAEGRDQKGAGRARRSAQARDDCRGSESSRFARA